MHARRWINVVVQLASDPGTVCDDVATAPVRISLLPPLTVVVGVTAAATWDRVCPESSIANVPLAAAKYSARMWIHQHLILLTNAVTNCTIAWAILGQTPAANVVEIRRWFNHYDECKEEDYQPRLNLHFRFVRVCVCVLDKGNDIGKFLRENFFFFFFKEKKKFLWWCLASALPFLLEKGEEKDIAGKLG